MKKQDWILILCVVAVLTPFFIPAAGIVMIAVSAVKKKKRPTGDETGSSAENP